MIEGESMNLRKILLTSLFLAITLILPFITGQILTIGNMLLPMHIPVILCGLICGWQHGFTIGFIAPILRGVMFGMPPLMPIGISMAFELSVYGMVSGYVFYILKEKMGYDMLSIYISLIVSMIAGRMMWGMVRYLIALLFGIPFSWHIFVTSAFITALPGIIVQLILIPVLMVSVKKDVFEIEM